MFIGDAMKHHEERKMTSPVETLLLANQWVAFYSAEPDFKFRAMLEVTFPTPTHLHFKKIALFSELGLGDDVVLTIDSPVTVVDGVFTVPTTVSQTLMNPQGQSATLQLTGQNYGYTRLWGAHQMAMMGRVFEIK
jgi:hypothetical protein